MSDESEDFQPGGFTGTIAPTLHTTLDVRVSADALKLEPGCVYALECQQPIPNYLMAELSKWADNQGIRFIVFEPGVVLKRRRWRGTFQTWRFRFVGMNHRFLPAVYWSNGGKPPTYRKIL